MLNKLTLLSASIITFGLMSLTLSTEVNATGTNNTESTQISDSAKSTAGYAVATYQQAMVDSLRELVKHNTVAEDGVFG